VRSETKFFAFGVVIGIAICALTFVLWFAWMFDRSKPPEEDRKLVERCERKGTTREQFAKALGQNRKYSQPDIVGLEKRLKQVREGMSMQQVDQLAGKSTFVEGSYDKSGLSFEGCYWYYVLSGEVADSGYFSEEEFHTVRFDKHDRVDIPPLVEAPSTK